MDAATMNGSTYEVSGCPRFQYSSVFDNGTALCTYGIGYKRCDSVTRLSGALPSDNRITW